LNFNSLLRGLDRDKDRLMRQVLLAIMKAMEKKAVEGYMRAHPGRCWINGRQPRSRKLQTSFGPICNRLAQVYDREKKDVFCPLVRRLRIEAYRRYQREAMETGIGQVIHLSYRLAGGGGASDSWSWASEKYPLSFLAGDS
jgi:hypothetical protein